MYILLIMVNKKSTKFDLKKVGEGSFCTCFNLRKASRVVTQIYEDVFRKEGIDLKGTQYSLLVNVFAYGPVQITKLSDVLVMDRTSLARNIKPLIAKGYLKVQSGKDKRRKLVEITPDGERILESAYPHWKSTQEKIVNEIGEKNWSFMFENINNFVPKFEDMI